MKGIYLLLISFVLVILGHGQNEFDVLRYSSNDFYGDARFNAMGGSFGALGANMSSLSINPGGIGVYKSSDFSFTPAFHYNFTESMTPSGGNDFDGKLNFHFGNIGLVGNFKSAGSWESVSFAIGYNRTANYSSRISIKSTTDHSFLDTYVGELNATGGIIEDEIGNAFPFSANLGYQAYLVNPTFPDSLLYNHVLDSSKNITQITNYQTKGGSGEMYFAFGGNYSDKLYLGALIGIPTVRYVYDRTYIETPDETDTLLNSFSVNDFVKTSGTGINLKLGLIYKVVDWFRIGAAFHTPTVYALTDNYETTLNSEFKDGSTYSVSSPYGSFDYIVTTPYRFISSASFVIGEYGVINGDYEIVDYSSAYLREDKSFGSSGADFSTENQNIRNNFQLTQNIRIGTEWRLDPFRIRAGYRYLGDPINDQFSVNNNANIYSLGFGIKQDEYYFDMAYALKTSKTQSSIVAEHNEFADVNLKDHHISFTLGFRF
ncbi:MAG: outer membrane protein transport protein [Vicingus serpentipes]|nr:outer membrane protein transport protein [Vicingus serpentipes]